MSDNSVPQKTCTKCERAFPATTIYFESRKLGKDGLRAQCRECRRTHRSERYASNPEYYRGKIDEYRKQHPEVVEKIYQNHNAKRRQRYQENPEYYRGLIYEYRAQNPDAYRKICKRHYEKYRERYLEARREWDKKNPERAKENSRKRMARYRARNPERTRMASALSSRQWRKNNPVKAGKYRHRIASLPYTFTDRQWQECLEYFHHTCAYCGAQQSFWYCIEMEHYIPISDTECPGTVMINIVPSCRKCNSSKGDRQPETWLIAKFGKRKANQILQRIQTYFESIEDTL